MLKDKHVATELEETKYFNYTRKRDGRLAAFDKRRIENAIFKAAQAVGGEDRLLAEELSNVVTLFLKKRFGKRIPTIEQIQDIVEKVLVETGHTKTAKAYILYRQKRKEFRDKTKVRKRISRRSNPTDPFLLVAPPSEDKVTSWDKKEIAEALQKEVKLEENLSWDIASAVEKKIFKTGIKQIFTSLIKALVNNELFERGSTKRLTKEITDDIATKITADFNKEVVSHYLKKEDWQIKENSNQDFSLQGLNLFASSKIIKNYWLNEVYPREIREAHTEGNLHIHDLGYLSVYCVGHDLEDLLRVGFKGAPAKAASKPPKHLRSALGQIVNFFYTLQGEAAGAQAFSSFDTLLAPFIRYDKLDYKQVKQALQEFIFNVNVPTRSGFQAPFTNVTLDLTLSPIYGKQPVIIGGEPQEEQYADFQEEMNLFNKAFFEVMLEGDAKGRVFSFPIPTYNITKDFDWDNENLEGLWKMTAKYGIPYFSNFINSDMKPEDARSMCIHPDEEIIVKEEGEVVKTTIGALARDKVKNFDSDGWAEVNNVVEALSLNAENYRIEWAKIKNFLKIKDNVLVTIKTADGKEIKVSQNHLVAVYTSEGIKTKLAKDIEKDDVLLTTRKTKDIFGNGYQIIGGKRLEEKLAYLIGFFVADGNYLYDSRYKQKIPRGIQFSFNTQDKSQQLIIKQLVQEIYGYELRFIQDPRYENSLRAYLYRSRIAQEWIMAGIEKYNKVAKIIFNSPLSIVQEFINGFFAGDGYKDGKEIHINDEGLARDLVILMTLAGINCTYRKREQSQVIRIQHTLGRGAQYADVVVDTLYNRVPQFAVATSSTKQFYNKGVMPCKSSLDRRDAHTEESIKILDSDLALVKAESIKIEYLPHKQEFYDIELEENHYFVHSLGNITHNCCRLRIDNRKLEKKGGGLFGSNPLTGSIGVVTINMPRMAHTSKNQDEFFKKLDKNMNLARESLEIKRKLIENLTEENLYPYTKFYLRNVRKRFGQYWKNHFSTIGLIGLNEACLEMVGENIASPQGKRFAQEVLDYMRNRLVEFQKETGNNYNLEATPAESTAYRLARIDKDKFGDEIICANQEEYKKGAEPYYTNSSQLPVNFTDDIFSALQLQDSLQTKYTGGTVFHTFIGEFQPSPESVKVLVRKICENFELPYFTITPTFSICPKCGYIFGEYHKCPHCGSECEVYSRVVGYLRPVSQWNQGKKEEFKQRKLFKTT